MENCVNCWEPLTLTARAISSQAGQGCSEGSETRSWSPERTVKAHECAAPYRGEDIVRAARKLAEACLKWWAITKLILAYAHDYTVAAPFMNWLDLRGKATKVGSFPKWVLDATTDTGETTDLSTTALETTQVSVTAAEIGIRRDVLDAVLEETIVGAQLFDFLVRDSGVLAAISLDDDICALFPSLATSVGSSGSNLTLANMVEAQAQVRINGQRGNLVYILDDQQALDYQAAQAADSATTMPGLMEPSVGIESGFLGGFFGQPVWQTGLCDTANTGANVVGACFIRGDLNPTTSCFGAVMTRDIRTELERNASARSTEFVMTAKWGVGEISDLSGAKIVTDA